MVTTVPLVPILILGLNFDPVTKVAEPPIFDISGSYTPTLKSKSGESEPPFLAGAGAVFLVRVRLWLLILLLLLLNCKYFIFTGP